MARTKSRRRVSSHARALALHSVSGRFSKRSSSYPGSSFKSRSGFSRSRLSAPQLWSNLFVNPVSRFMSSPRVAVAGGQNVNKNFSASRKYSSPRISPILVGGESSVSVCSRRRARKEVIHASGVAGSGVRKPKFSNKSKVKCK